MPNQPTGPILVSDFDGTMTRLDFYQVVRARWWNNSDPDPWEDYVAGRLSHFDALNQFFDSIRADESSLRAITRSMELDPTLEPALQRLSAAGWTLVIASAGCEWYIRHLLNSITTPFTLHANPGYITSKGSLKMVPPVKSPFFCPDTGINKAAVVRDALARGSRVAFAGDGPPDIAPAQLVPAHLRFARGHLAQALAERGQAFHPLRDWRHLAETLLASPTL